MIENKLEIIKDNWPEVKERLRTEFSLDDSLYEMLIESMQICDYYDNFDTVIIAYADKNHEKSRLMRRYAYVNYSSFIEQTIEELTGIHCTVDITYEKN